MKYKKTACIVLLLLVCITQVNAQTDIPYTISKQTIKIDNNGDATVDVSYGPLPLSTYNLVVNAFKPNPAMLTRSFERATDRELTTIQMPVFDDMNRLIKFKWKITGYAKIVDEYENRDVWEINIPENSIFVISKDNLFVFAAPSIDPLTKDVMIEIYNVILPANSVNAEYNKRIGTLSYELASPTEHGRPKLTIDLKCKDEIMPAIYKVYGKPELKYWLAKTIIKHEGGDTIYNVKISYKLGKYMDWTLNNIYYKLVPNQTIVDVLYPCLSSEITKITTETPAILQVKINYEINGKEYEKIKSYRLSILGINDVVYSDLPPNEISGWYDAFENYWVLAAFVTPNEKTLNKFAKDATRGIGSALSDDNAISAMEAIYNAICNEGIGYITEPPAFWSGKVTKQYVQYPKDTLDRKAGTCIDLAILYASACEAVGLRAYIALVPGHAFPIIELPESGQWVPVEMTGVPDTSFDDAWDYGVREYNEYIANGYNYYLIDIQELWKEGVTPPW